MTLTEFLLARIVEDEATAHHTLDDYAAHKPSWEVAGSGVVFLGDDDSLDDLLTIGDAPVAQHIALHDPARVLAECEAKRRIVGALDGAGDMRSAVDFWMDQPSAPSEAALLIRVLRLLATPYADHPDYREEWRG